MKRLLLAALLVAPALAGADEGMWTFNNFPSAKVEGQYGFKVPTRPGSTTCGSPRCASPAAARPASSRAQRPGDDQPPLRPLLHRAALRAQAKDYVKRRLLRQDRGRRGEVPRDWRSTSSSTSPTSPRGSRGHRGAARPRLQRGPARPSMAAHREGVPDRRRRSAARWSASTTAAATTSTSTAASRTCAWSSRPEFAIAFFGGDPDNFMFPRYDLDVAFLRVYEDGKPAEHGALPRAGRRPAPRTASSTFVSGNPGGTTRQLTVAQLEYERDVALPERLVAPGRAARHAHRVPAPRRRSRSATPTRPALRRRERPQGAARAGSRRCRTRPSSQPRCRPRTTLRRALAADPERKQRATAGAFDAIAQAVDAARRSSAAAQLQLEERRAGFGDALRRSPARWCAAPTSAPSRTPSACASTPTRRCPR